MLGHNIWQWHALFVRPEAGQWREDNTMAELEVANIDGLEDLEG